MLEFPGYVAPGWLLASADPGAATTFEVAAPALDSTVTVRIWSPADSPDDEPLPLLLVHDGPEYDALAGLTRYLGAAAAGGWLPRLRAALLSPGQRNAWYAASSRYARALAGRVIPVVTQRVASTVRVGMGTGLGALAMLHAHCRHPGIADGLFLQSGSFFVAALDGQEQRFRYFRASRRSLRTCRPAACRARPFPSC